MATLDFPFTATEKQLPAVLSSAENNLLGGARGGGKSAGLGGIGVNYAYSWPGVTIVAMRADLADFKATTLVQIEKMLPSDKSRWRHHKTDHYIDIQSVVPHHWSRILYVEGKDPNNLKSGNIAMILGDEAEEIPFATFMHLSGGLRQTLPPDVWDKTNPLTGREFGQVPPYLTYLASNPAPCWLMDLFPVLDEEREAWDAAYAEDPYFEPFPSPSGDFRDKLLDPDYAFFPYLASDNPYNPQGYFDRLVRMYRHDPVLLARNVYGRWDISMEGLVYQLLKVHRWYSPTPGDRLWKPGAPVVLGIDPSNGAGTYACVVVQFIGDRVMQIDEWGGEGARGSDENLIEWLHAQPWAGDIADAVVDSAKADSITRLRLNGLPARPCARKEVTAQINAVKAALTVDPAKGYAPYILDEARCPRTREEFGKRVYRKASQANPDLRVPEQPVKAHDHFLNALEYLVLDKMPVVGVIGGRYRKPGRQALGQRGFRGRPYQDLLGGFPLNANGYRAPSRQRG